MLAIRFWFPGGRYHATPWDHHVNEGIVEWPPSPWRILRALISTWHLKAQGAVERGTLGRMIGGLASEQPRFALPRVWPAHTRHYMPLFEAKTAKIFDAFLHVDPHEPLQVLWTGLDLDAAARDALGVLVTRLSYLGRAESWVRAELTAHPDREPNCAPLIAGGAQPSGEIVRLLMPMSQDDFAAWRAAMVDQQLTRRLEETRRLLAGRGADPDTAKLSAKDRTRIEEGLPPSIPQALEASTDDLRRNGWSQPPGARWAEYDRPADALRPAVRARPATSVKDLPRVARFAIAGAVLPRLTDAISVADRIHQALLSLSDGAPVFAGRDERGNPLVGHRHAFILPEADERTGRIRLVTIYATMGFEERARVALDRLTRTWGHGGHDLQLVLVGVGQEDDFASPSPGRNTLLMPSRVWVSRTPFVPTRHPKQRRGGAPKLDQHGLHVGGTEHDLLRLLAAGGLPSPERVEPVASTLLGGRQTRWLAFRTDRPRGGGMRASRAPVGFRVVFRDPVAGPIALGYGAHFGLGLFEPERAR